MIKIEYPAYTPLIGNRNNKDHIFDPFRKKWVLLTPEEWVRQHFLQFLTQSLYYPASLIAIEKKLMLGEMHKRFDIVVYDNNTKPWLVVECKEMNVPLTEKTFQQALRYNSGLLAEYIVITNGNYCMAFKRDGNTFLEINNLPKVNA
ncbi:MAG: type I restriction enzyme HsdR N-terminal domain-containing protein [Ferruginibacter sp.]